MIPDGGIRRREALVLVVAGAILVASVVPIPGGQPSDGPLGLIGADKWIHALAYATLAATVAYARREHNRWAFALVVAVPIAFGVAVEGVQALLPLRVFDLADAGANALGALLAASGWWLVGSRNPEGGSHRSRGR